MSLKLKVDFRVQEKVLRVKYTATNEGPVPAYLLDVLWMFTDEGAFALDPHHAVVSLHADGSLHVGKILPPLPTLCSVEFAIMPFAHVVQPRDSFEGSFDLPLPVREYNPYYDEEGATWQTVEVKTAQFYLSWMPAMPDLETPADPLGVGVRLKHPALLKLVQTLQTPPSPLAVQGEMRTDEFERF